MTEPATDELDQAVARVLELKFAHGAKDGDVWLWEDNDGHLHRKPRQLSQDWNALAAARASLESEAGYHIFQRDVGGAWQYWGEISMIGEFAFVGGDLASEALALAKCIKGASDDNR